MVIFYYMYMFYLMIMSSFSFLLFLFCYSKKISFYFMYELVKNSSMKFEFLLLIDWIALLFMSVVLLITAMVIMYSIEYMYGDYYILRFIMLILMFVFSMLLLIMSPNMISILLGWDGLGLVSYCLVIYYQGLESYNSGMVTVLMNRVGDILILMSVALLINIGSWNFTFWGFLNENYFIFVLLMVAAFTKSAQIPFSSWLPKAMAAPTPVSALVHSSTLVTAGVYLMIRLDYYYINKYIYYIMMVFSILTMFLAGLAANNTYDLKKIIALSTLSQLGLMIFCLSFKMAEVSLFHLLGHAMFKSLLFMCAGVIIHYMQGCQDIRFIGMALYYMPLVSFMFNISILSLCGIPFLTGFYSKDLILELYMMNSLNKYIFHLLFLSMGLTVAYSFRLMYYVFIKNPKIIIVYNKYYSSKSLMSFSMYTLFIFSVVQGSVMGWMLFTFKSEVYLPWNLKYSIYLYFIIGLMIGSYMKQMGNSEISYFINQMLIFISMLWLMPIMYMYMTYLILCFNKKMLGEIELGWLEYFLSMMLMCLENFFYWDFIKKNYMHMLIFLVLIILINMF